MVLVRQMPYGQARVRKIQPRLNGYPGKTQFLREASEKINRNANEMPLNSGMDFGAGWFSEEFWHT